MFTLKRKPSTIPSADQAMPGRADPVPTAASHFVTGAALKGPYPQGSEKALFGLGCFWGAERKFWRCRASTSPPSAMPAGSRRTRLTKRFARADRA